MKDSEFTSQNLRKESNIQKENNMKASKRKISNKNEAKNESSIEDRNIDNNSQDNFYLLKENQNITIGNDDEIEQVTKNEENITKDEKV